MWLVKDQVAGACIRSDESFGVLPAVSTWTCGSCSSRYYGCPAELNTFLFLQKNISCGYSLESQYSQCTSLWKIKKFVCTCLLIKGSLSGAMFCSDCKDVQADLDLTDHVAWNHIFLECVLLFRLEHDIRSNVLNSDIVNNIKIYMDTSFFLTVLFHYSLLGFFPCLMSCTRQYVTFINLDILCKNL